MKNIHIIPTDKPSRLFKFADNLIKNDLIGLYDFKEKGYQPQNIYITNSKEINLNDYITDGYRVWKWKDDSSLLGRKKIILTTDEDLIKDAIQSIDDEFLEWFIKNPSCEGVEVADLWKDGNPSTHFSYQIIIPQEESKQETLVKSAENYYDIIAEKSSLYGRDEYIAYSQGVQDGVKFQQERMYSEEEVINAFNEGQALNVRGKLIQGKDWFEQNKKK